MVRKETPASSAIPKKFPMTDTLWVSLGKNKMQLLFFIIFLLLCPFLALFLREFNNIYQMRIVQRPDYKEWPLYSDLLIALMFSALLTAVLLVSQTLFTGYAAKLVSERYQGQERMERAERMIKSLFKGIYFTVVVGFAYFIAKDSYFFPPSLGGKGNVDEAFKDTPYFDQTGVPYIKEYFMLQLGYHFHSLIIHVTGKIRNDFMEMLLHHSITVLLVSLAYLMNYLPMSLLILFSHDISDAFVSYTRFLVDTNFKYLTFFVYLFLIISWFYTRLVIFPFDLIRVSCYTNPMMHEMYGIGILGAMVHVLVLLHLYWFVLLINMGIKFVKTATPEDTQQSLSQSHSH